MPWPTFNASNVKPNATPALVSHGTAHNAILTRTKSKELTLLVIPRACAPPDSCNPPTVHVSRQTAPRTPTVQNVPTTPSESVYPAGLTSTEFWTLPPTAACVSKGSMQLPQVSACHAPQPVPPAQIAHRVSVAWLVPHEQAHSAHVLLIPSSPRTPSATAKAVKKIASRAHHQEHVRSAFLRSL